MIDPRERFGMPHVGQICSSTEGELVISEFDENDELPFKFAGLGDRYGIAGWGCLCWPKGTCRAPDLTPSEWRPNPAWGRKGPIVPPEKGMVIDLGYGRRDVAGIQGKHVQYRLADDSPSALLHIDDWERVRILELPAGYTWPRPKVVDVGILDVPSNIKRFINAESMRQTGPIKDICNIALAPDASSPRTITVVARPGEIVRVSRKSDEYPDTPLWSTEEDGVKALEETVARLRRDNGDLSIRAHNYERALSEVNAAKHRIADERDAARVEIGRLTVELRRVKRGGR